MAAITMHGASHPGRVRVRNEDSFRLDPRRGLAVVADGMGGHAGGDVASRLAADAFVAALSWRVRFGWFRREALRTAVQAANHAVYQAASGDAQLRGMGTTLVAVLCTRRAAHVVHVGDSRAYRLHDDQLECLTKDHVWPTPEGTPSNVLTRAIGSDPQVDCDDRIVGLAHGDRLLLCSDGLSRTTDDDEIRAVLRQHPTAPAAVAALIDGALAHGAPDNVTVVVVDL